MSLMSRSTTMSKKVPLQEAVILKALIVPFDTENSNVGGYTPAVRYTLTNGSNNIFMIDFPYNFFNLYSPTDPNNTPDAQMLYSSLGTLLIFDLGQIKCYELKWFPDLTGFTVPAQLPGHSRVWFCVQDPTGVAVMPPGVVLIELAFGKALPARNVLPVPV